LNWLSDGWHMFNANPAIWAIQALLVVIVLAALGVVPLLGWAAAPLALPVLMGGLLAGARAQERGEKLRIDHLFDGLREHPGNLAMIGAFHLLGALLAALIAAAVGGSAALTGMMVGAFAGMGMAAGGMMLAMGVFTVLWLLLLMALWFAPALVMLHGVSPLDAMKLSARACLSNLATFAVLGLIFYVLTWLALLPAGLGMLIFIPVLAGALHAGWQDTFVRRPALPAPAEANTGSSDTPNSNPDSDY
jgi:uncharacterized membrane protein